MKATVNRDALAKFLNVEKLPRSQRIATVGRFVADKMMEKYSITAYDINSGYCFIWAYLVWAIVQDESISFQSNYNHVVVSYKGKFYDSDHITGSKLLTKMEFFSSDSGDTMDVEQMCRYWSRHGYRAAELKKAMRLSAISLYRKALRVKIS